MKAIVLGLVAALFSVSVMADVDFSCSYRESYKVQKGAKIKTKYGKPVVKIKGSLKEGKGGKLSITSAFLYGNKSMQKIKFYEVERANESSLKFAKFHNKSKEQVAAKTWLPTYTRFSLPKKALQGKEKAFPAYFGFFRAKEDLRAIGSDDPQATAIEVTEEELREFAKENEKEIEYQLWCKA